MVILLISTRQDGKVSHWQYAKSSLAKEIGQTEFQLIDFSTYITVLSFS